jgi:hypothetical protein
LDEAEEKHRRSCPIRVHRLAAQAAKPEAVVGIMAEADRQRADPGSDRETESERKCK